MFAGLRRARGTESADEVPEYWITYSDLMVSLLMTFALLLFLAMARLQSNIKSANAIVKANNQAIQAAAKALNGSGQLIALDSATGTLTMNSEVLFDFGSDVVRPEAIGPLTEIATKFIPSLLMRPAVDTMIREIAIEGHTDTVGTFMSNSKLAQARAYAVLKTMVEASYGIEKAARFRQLVTATGKSEVEPIFANGVLDPAKSRRIEIHIRFRDDAILKSILAASDSGQVKK